VLLTISNIFMTFAWYGHLKYRQAPLFKVIIVSWGIAFFEYCFQVPANRIGSYDVSTVRLKTIQEMITLTVFSVFSVLYQGRTHQAELPCGVRADRGGGVCDLQEMVTLEPFPGDNLIEKLGRLGRFLFALAMAGFGVQYLVYASPCGTPNPDRRGLPGIRSGRTLPRLR